LIDMIVEDVHDADAADALSALANDSVLAEQIATWLVYRLADSVTAAQARRRLTQALADIPGITAARALADLSHDEDRVVASTATYVRGLRSTS
ncbi:MAG: hypothetical protein QOH17_1003, partial [Pseudonocardiales bacterium]|nr:hypothetical protein [Pseudonocardiales bacterium]